MIAAWMVYATLVAALLAAGALALDRALRLADRQARWIWIMAVAASLTLPLLRTRTASPPAGTRDVGVIQVVTRAVTAPVPNPSPSLGILDTPLRVAWAAASALVLLVLLLGQQRLRRETARGPVREIDGHWVCVTAGSGPAVVGGLKRATIILPAWLAERDSEARRLAVRHEAEHLETGDIRLLAIAALAAVACPWNPAIWWQVHRLRDAVELDCDHRLLRAGVDVRTYGALLLEVARRAPIRRLALALAARPSLLSRRIDHMTAIPSPGRRLRALLGAALGVVLVALACEAPGPVAETSSSAVLDESQVDTPPIRVSSPPLTYPPLLREAGIEGRVVVEFVVDTSGHVDPNSVEVISSTHKAFELPAVDVVKGSLFRPAIIGGAPTAMRTRQPVEFHIMKPAAAPSTAPAPARSVDTTLVFLRTQGPTTDTLAVVLTPGRRR
jgi:TonB family protein